MESKNEARELIIEEWDWNQEELGFINGLDDARCVQLLSNMNKASRYTSMFTVSKYLIFALFIAVYTLRYFQLHRLSLIVQMIIIPAGIFAVLSFVMLKRIEANADYKALFLA